MGSPAQGSFLCLQESHLLKRARVLGHVSPVRLFVTLWTVTHQAPLSLRFSRQDYWSGLPCPPPGSISDPGIEPSSPVSPALQADSLPLAPPRKPLSKRFKTINKYIINRLAHGYGNCCSQGQVGPEKTFSQKGRVQSTASSRSFNRTSDLLDRETIYLCCLSAPAVNVTPALAKSYKSSSSRCRHIQSPVENTGHLY